jgi:hypothetical protein
MESERRGVRSSVGNISSRKVTSGFSSTAVIGDFNKSSSP